MKKSDLLIHLTVIATNNQNSIDIGDVFLISCSA